MFCGPSLGPQELDPCLVRTVLPVMYNFYILVLLLAVVVHRRKSDDLYKDTDDIRENIINYEDEGGGEGDMTGYDLNVLRLQYDGDNYSLPHDKSQSNHLQRRGMLQLHTDIVYIYIDIEYIKESNHFSFLCR